MGRSTAAVPAASRNRANNRTVTRMPV